MNLLPDDVVPAGGEALVDGLACRHHRQLIRRGDRQRTKQQSVDDTEDGGVGADAERQRENRDEGKARRSAQGATAQRASCQRLSSADSHPASRTCCVIAVVLPSSIRAARVAASRLRPARMCRSIAASRYAASSSSRSCSTLLAVGAARGRRRARGGSARGITTSPSDARMMRAMAAVCASQSSRRVGRGAPAGGGQRVVFRAPVVLGRAPLALDQAVALETAEGGEERPGVDLERAVADLLEAHADAVAVHRLERQRFENQHVQRALHERAGLVRRRHRLASSSQSR